MAANRSYDVPSTEIQVQSAQRVKEGSFLGPLDSSSKYRVHDSAYPTDEYITSLTTRSFPPQNCVWRRSFGEAINAVLRCFLNAEKDNILAGARCEVRGSLGDSDPAGL